MNIKTEQVGYKLLLAERRIRAEENRRKELGLTHKNNEEILGILSIRKEKLEEIWDSVQS